MPPEGVRDALFLGDQLEHHPVGQAQANLFGVQKSPRHVREEEQQAHRVEQHDLRHKLEATSKGNAGKGVVNMNCCRKKFTTASSSQ